MSELTPNPEQIYGMWRIADPLCDAWFRLGDEDLRVQYQDGKNQARAEVAKRLMASDIFRAVANSELIALGIRTAPDVSDGPVIIKPWLFEQPLNPSWEEDRIELAGWVFSKVRIFSELHHGISPVNDATLNTGHSEVKVEQKATPAAATVDNIGADDSTTESFRKIIEIISQVESDQKYLALKKEAKIAVIQEIAKARRLDGMSPKGPSRATIFKAYKERKRRVQKV